MSTPETPTSRDQITCDAIGQIIASIAMSEAALSHVINAEGEKIQYALGALPGSPTFDRAPSIEQLLDFNKSVKDNISAVSVSQALLLSKLSAAIGAYEYCYDSGSVGPTGPTGPPGEFRTSFCFVWTDQMQSLQPAAVANSMGPQVFFTDKVVEGTGLSALHGNGGLGVISQIDVLESGFYSIRWEIYKTGYDSAFALFLTSQGSPNGSMIPGSNYGAMAHDEKYSGQAITYIEEGSALTLNRIDDLYTQSTLNQIGGNTILTAASIVVTKEKASEA
ncbi:MAG: hypothetical protein FWG10_14395 [Eubacteriaceae bacterium]|nr:hypothetical protein [Eubacteriaceae bacterium]